MRVNGQPVPPGKDAPIDSGGLIDLGGVKLVFVASPPEGEPEDIGGDAADETDEDGETGSGPRPVPTLVALTEFQALLCAQSCISGFDTLEAAVPIAFGALTALMWLWYFLSRALAARRYGYGPDEAPEGFAAMTLAFFLCSIGLSVAASSAPWMLWRHIAFLALGLTAYTVVSTVLRDLGLAVRLRWPVGAAGLVLLAVNLALGDTIFGARNWLSLGGISFQPSEFVKAAFVFAGSATLDRLFARRNLLLFIAYAGACVTALALMRDFGSALIFFAAFLVIAFIRSGDAATIFLSIGGAALAGVIASAAWGHIAARFGSWGKAWENVSTSGYQQARAMSAAASGGLFGKGSGGGWLRDVFAADTDLVFGMVCEELGLIVALSAIAAVVVLAVFAVRSTRTARSTFYVIGACASASILVFQLSLNVLGSMDILPFTGVTFPFVSRGGSSLVSCFCLMSFMSAERS
jgi:cell division protein FtsW (lipid II flippase)